MGNLTIATTFIVMVNILMWFSSLAMLSVNPAGTSQYNLEGTIIEQSVASGTNVLANDIENQLPTSESTSISPGSTSLSFTDVFTNLLGWFKTTVPGVKYVYGVVAAPYNILNAIPMDEDVKGYFVVGVGTLWYLISLLVLVAFMAGRD